MCRSCGYANDAEFNFCQFCGAKRPGPIKVTQTNDYIVEKRLKLLDNMLSSKAYSKKKSALELEFCKFLETTCGGKCLLDTTPLDIKKFLVKKDDSGKTKIHEISCKYLGKLGKQSCSCPSRLASGTIQSIIGQLKSVFENLGRGKSWNSGQGNPACSLEVHKYFEAVQLEQAMAHVGKKQAKPLFSG